MFLPPPLLPHLTEEGGEEPWESWGGGWGGLSSYVVSCVPSQLPWPSSHVNVLSSYVCDCVSAALKCFSIR